MPYLGNTPSTSFATVVKDSFNGGSTAYTLSKVATTNSVSVFVENVRQEPTTAYAVSGTTLTFTATTPSGTGNIYVLHMNPTTTTTHPAAQNLTAVDGTFTGTVTAGSTLDMNGTELILDADADTSITADTDDRIDFKTGGTDRLQVQSTSGNNVVIADGLTLTDGNLIVASGHGIDFSATSNTSASNASTTSELFDDYEEGTWTPAFSTGISGSYAQQFGRYVKTGSVVYAQFWILTNSSGVTSSGAQVKVSGLPFTIGADADSQDQFARGFGQLSFNNFNTTLAIPYGNKNTDLFEFYQSGSTGYTFGGSGTAINSKYLIGGFLYTIDM